MVKKLFLQAAGLKQLCVIALILTLWAAPAQAQKSDKPQEAASAVARALPASVRSEEVKFDGGEIKLAGTLLLPKLEAGKRAPAVLLIGAAGPAQRDGLKFGNAEQLIYRELAEWLAAQGYAVLRFDKRCVGASACKPQSRFEEYTDDARAALVFLRERAEVDPAKVFIFGHGEGGFIGSIIAANDEKLAGLALAAAPGRTLNKLIRDQLQFRMKEAGKPDAEIAALLARLDRTVRQMMSGSAEFVTDKFDPANPYEAVVLGLTKQPEFVVPLFINDPLQVVNNVKAPVLILQGEKDWQTSVKDAQYLNESLTRSYHSDHTLRLFPEVDHLLKTNKGAAGTASYADTTRPLDAELLTFLHEWLQKRSK